MVEKVKESIQELLASKDYESAIQQLTEIIEQDDDNPEAYYQRGLCYWELNGYEEPVPAILDFTKAIQLNQNRPEVFYRLAIAKWHNGNELTEVINDLDKAIKLDPLYADAYKERGFIGASLPGNYEQAMDDFETALKLNPDPGYLSFKAFIKGMKGDLHGAIDELTRAIQMKPKFLVQFYLDRARLYDTVSEYKLSIADFSCALNIAPHIINVYEERAKVRIKIGDTQGAREDFEKSFKYSDYD